MGKPEPPVPDTPLKAALSSWNDRVRQSTIPLLSHCHASIRRLRRLVVLSRRYHGLTSETFTGHADATPALEPVRALRELASQLEAVEAVVREVADKLDSAEQTSEALARDYDCLIRHLAGGDTVPTIEATEDPEPVLADDRRVLAQLVEAQKAEIDRLRQELEVSTRERARLGAPRDAGAMSRGVEVHNVHDFILESPLAEVSANSAYYQRLLEAANATGGTKIPMGELLTIAGLISEHELRRALHYQQDGRRRPLGALLVDLGFAKEDAIAQALAAQLSLPFVVLEREFVREGALDKIPRHLARRHASFPLNFTDHALTVAMANPLDLIALEDLHIVSGMHIKPCVAAREEIERHITTYYL